MIIGLTGSFCSGKDTIGEYLVQKKGFRHFSLSDELRLELKKMRIEPTRDNLIRIGSKIRAKFGFAVLAKRVVKKLKGGKDYIITSIRHPSEIRELRKLKNFILINIDAPAKVRFSRMQERNRTGDPKTFKRFIELEKKESKTKGSCQQLLKCSQMADITFMNENSSLKQLHNNIESLLKELNSKKIERNINIKLTN